MDRWKMSWVLDILLFLTFQDVQLEGSPSLNNVSTFNNWSIATNSSLIAFVIQITHRFQFCYFIPNYSEFAHLISSLLTFSFSVLLPALHSHGREQVVFPLERFQFHAFYLIYYPGWEAFGLVFPLQLCITVQLGCMF